MVRPTFLAWWRISVLRHHDIHSHVRGPLYHCVEIFDLEPQQCAVPVRSVVRIANSSMVMLYLKAVKLQHEVVSPN